MAVQTPSVGVLLRQSVACFLGVRLDAVAIVGVTQTNASVPAMALVVSSDDSVNLATAGSLSCGTRNESGTRALLGVRSSGSPYLRRLGAGGGGGDTPSAIVSLAVQVLACPPTAGAAPQLAAALVTHLAAFNRSVAAGGPAYAPFVVAVAGASGVNATAVYAQGSVTGSAATMSSTTAGSLETPTVPVAIVVGASIAVVSLLVGLLVAMLWYRRSSAHKNDHAASRGMAAEQGEFSGENPLRRGARDGKVTLAAVQAVAAIPVSQSIGSGMDSALAARNP